jgi:hypothetical protein
VNRPGSVPQALSRNVNVDRPDVATPLPCACIRRSTSAAKDRPRERGRPRDFGPEIGNPRLLPLLRRISATSRSRVAPLGSHAVLSSKSSKRRLRVTGDGRNISPGCRADAHTLPCAIVLGSPGCGQPPNRHRTHPRSPTRRTVRATT